MLYLSEVVEDVEAALGDGDVHGVLGADADGCLRFRENDKVVSVNWTLVLDRVALHLQEQTQEHHLNTVLIIICHFPDLEAPSTSFSGGQRAALWTV